MLFVLGFEGRLQDLMDTQRNMDPVDPDKPVLVAGDPEREHIKKCEKLGGIPYPRNVVDYMVKAIALFPISGDRILKS